VTKADVTTYYTRRRNVDAVVGDEEGGANRHCSVLNDELKLVCGRDAVFFYDAEEKGNCYVFDGPKKALLCFNTYLLVVTEDNKRDMVTIYDLKNKLIAYQERFQPITAVVAEWGSIFVLTKQQFFQLNEKDLPAKMEALFSRNLYTIAISLALSQNCDESYIKYIFQRSGDHLYSKGDFDGAMQQYVETINYVEPSSVIRKFLDAQRIHNLTHYLQALHHGGRAKGDHTTLLLNCYTKLKDTEKLDQFIKSESISFDVPTAIKVLREAGYFTHALFLAERHKVVDLFVEIHFQMSELPAER